MGVLNDNIVGGAAGASTGQETWALSSNDWDYTYSNNEHPVAGNPLGDHTIGAYWKATSHNNGISCLITLDGDFEITFTLAETNQSEFGVHAIDEDDTRTTDSRVGMSNMTNSFWYRDESVTDFMIGSSAQSDTHTFADGSVVKIERVSGTIKVYDDGVVVHTYGTTYTGAMRFGAGDPGPAEADYDNFKITDSEGIQRDGMLDEDTSGSDSTGDKYSNNAHAGFRFRATRTGTVTGGTVKLSAVTAAYNSTFGIYTDNNGSPGTLIGSVSGQVSTSAGNNVFTLTGASNVTKGTLYWAVFSDADLNGLGYATIAKLSSGQQDFISGTHDTITSITGSASNPFPFQIKIETTEEPKPDWDTLLLIHSDTSDASTTFVDSSQYGRTVTVVADAQHDTAQKKFGASSILFDGTGDYIHVPDSTEWDFSRDFTLECWFRLATVSVNNPLLSKATAAAWSGTSWSVRVKTDNKVNLEVSNNGGSGVSISGSTTILVNTWYHVAAIRNATNFDLYINGTSEANATSTLTIENTSGTVQIGSGVNPSPTQYLDGWIDEVRISNVARWDANFTPSTSPYP